VSKVTHLPQAEREVSGRWQNAHGSLTMLQSILPSGLIGHALRYQAHSLHLHT